MSTLQEYKNNCREKYVYVRMHEFVCMYCMSYHMIK